MSEGNRIGEQCWYRQGAAGGPYLRGWLRAWSTDHEEYEAGPGQVPVAVIEDFESGAVMSIYVGRVSFAVKPPGA